MPIHVREIRNRNRGMFSVVNEVVDHLYVAEREKYAFHIRWTSCYEEQGMGPNAWTYYFENCFDIDEEGAGVAGILPPFDNRKGSLIAPRVPTGLGLPTDRDAMKRIIDRYIRLKPQVREKLEGFAGPRFDAGGPILGLHIRGPGRPLPALTKGHELQNGVPFKLYFEQVDEYLDRHGDCRIFLCTDAEMVVDAVRRRFGQRLFLYPAQRHLQGEMHLRPANRGHGYRLGEDILVEAYLLSRVDFLIHGNSNVTNFVLCNNPWLAHAYVYARRDAQPADRVVSATSSGAWTPDQTRGLVTLCLRAYRDPQAGAAMRARVARQEPDWTEVGRVAEREGVAPLLSRVLQNETFVPDLLRRKLRRLYLASGSRNLLLLRELGMVVEELGAAGVPSIVLGGAALAKTVYGRVGLRPFAKLEALLRREHLETARQALAGLGFATAKSEKRAGTAAVLEDPVVLVRPGPIPVPIELHRSLFESPVLPQRVDPETLWGAAVPLLLGRATGLVLDPVATLLHLACKLAVRHGGRELLRRQDIGALLTSQGCAFDWPLLLERTRAFSLEWPIREAVLGAAEDGATVPSDVVEQIRRLAPSRTPTTER